MLKRAEKLYIEYLEADYKKKLNGGNLLVESGKILMEIDQSKLDIDSRSKRAYLLKKVAEDLLKQMIDMAHTKQYDCSPILEEYTYLAFDFAFEYYDSKANRLLIPYLREVMFYENYNSDKTKTKVFRKLFNDSLEKEREYINYFEKKYE